MKLVVTHTGIAWRGRLIHGGRSYPCALGRSGIHAGKREGDGRTPAGEFALRYVLYRPDRMRRPKTALPVKPISLPDGWCDDARHSAYNQPVRLPIPASAERLRRSDHVYDLIVVIGHNDAPPIRGNGSAIFLHIAHWNLAPTAGCIALKRADLLAILAQCDSRSRIVIGREGQPGPLT